MKKIEIWSQRFEAQYSSPEALLAQNESYRPLVFDQLVNLEFKLSEHSALDTQNANSKPAVNRQPGFRREDS